MKKRNLITVLMSVVLAATTTVDMPTFAAADQVQNTLSTTETGLLSTSGIYDSITWSVEDNKLTVTGTGAVLPDSEGAFPWESYRHQIESVVVGEGITALGDWTFTYMECLKSIELPETLESIGKDCFSYDTALPELNLPRSVTSVGSCCAAGCTSLRSASLPGVNDIPQLSFYNCSALEYITLSDQLSHVDARAFTGCVRLLKDSPFATVGNVMYTYTGDDHIVRIPEGITVIADGAFSYEHRGDLHYTADDRLIAVICPQSLKHIGANAFYSCVELAELELPDGLCSVGENAFEKCRSLHSLTIPESVTAIGTQNGHTLKEITGKGGTAAEQFAKSAGIPFCDRDDLPAAVTIDPQKDVWYFGNSGKVFGKEYFFTERDRALVDALDTIGLDEKLNGPWTGACFGLSLTVLLAAYGVFTPDMLQTGAKTLSEVEANPAIVSMINYYHVIAASKDYLEQVSAASAGESVPQMVWRMIRTADQKPLLIDMKTKNSSHAMLAYGTEQGAWEWNGKSYDGRVTVWDSNYPTALNEGSCVYYDSNTLDYCIPQYGVTVTEGEPAEGGIKTVCGNLSILNAHPYPFTETVQTGDIDCDGEISVADAVLLMRCVSEERSVPVKQAGLDAADLDGDGLVSIRDVQKLLEQLAGFV